MILYEHPLLGEGIATRLRVEAGVDVVLASVHDRQAVLAALGLAPQVVVFERCDEVVLLDLAALAPRAELVDVSAVIGRGARTPQEVTGFELILQALAVGQVPSPTPSPEARSGAVRR